MEFWVLDRSYNTVGLVDMFSMAVWTTRFQDTGEFSLKLPCTREIVELLQADRYLALKDDPYYMIIEERDSQWEWKVGDEFTITGRDLSSVMERRVIYHQIDVENVAVQSLVQRILNENIINPSDSRRRIPGFIFKASTDPRITGLIVEKAQYLGEEVLETVTKICQDNEIGFRVLPINDGGFQFELYAGTDRSYNQEANPWVVFSDAMENIGRTGFTENHAVIRNTCLVHNERESKGRIVDANGEPTGSYVDDKTVVEAEVFSNGAKSGLDRREMFVNSSKSDKNEDGSAMSEEEYRAILATQGSEELAEHQIDTVFTGKVDDNRQFLYGRDFTLGDVCQIVNKYGIEQAVRVAEVVRTHDKTGDHVTPSFVNLPD